MDKLEIGSELVENIYIDISNIIARAKIKVQNSLNSEMVLLYWHIGKRIRTEILDKSESNYGEEVITKLSKKLTHEYGRGYSRSNLFNMIKFYDKINRVEIIQTLSGQLSWSHIVELLRIDDELKMNFYISMSTNERWSVRTLKERINSMLYERTHLSKKPDETIRNDLKLLDDENKMSLDIFLRDPYVLDFLEMKETYSEHDLESAILVELERFILEFGRDFAFLGRQVRITVGNRDYYIDLLFYHRKMRRLVLIELKLGEFKPEHKGQVELYLRWLDKHERNEGEDSPIGIILCAEKSNETVELLELDKSGIHVAQYLTQMPPKEVLEEKLFKAIELAKSKLATE
jgi:predicted nuclease of restriction endonuclease-like (RecB) superfamily